MGGGGVGWAINKVLYQESPPQGLATYLFYIPFLTEKEPLPFDKWSPFPYLV